MVHLEIDERSFSETYLHKTHSCNKDHVLVDQVRKSGSERGSNRTALSRSSEVATVGRGDTHQGETDYISGVPADVLQKQ